MRLNLLAAGLFLALLSPFSFAAEDEENSNGETEQTSEQSGEEKTEESKKGATEAEPDCD